MKILYKFLFLAIAFSAVSCDKGDVFTGSPVGTNVEFVTLKGTISSTETAVVASQKFPITITLPQSFPMDVSVEVTALLTNSDKRTRKYFIIPANTTTFTGPTVLMNAPGAETGSLPFNMELKVYLSAITSAVVGTPLGFEGKQYSLTSDPIILDYGDSAYGGVNPNRLSVRLDWVGPYSTTSPTSYNNLNIVLKKNGVVTTVSPLAQNTQPISGTTTTNPRYEVINFLSTAPDATYTIEVYAAKLVMDPMDMPYRFTVRFPNDDVRTFTTGLIPQMTVGTAATAIPKLQIIKTTDVSGAAQYAITSL